MSKWKAAIVPYTWSPSVMAALSIEALRRSCVPHRAGSRARPRHAAGRASSVALPVSSLAGRCRPREQLAQRLDDSPQPARQWISPSSPSEPIARSAPGSSRDMLEQMLSNTGCASAIEPLTTRSTSAVAVSRSSASLRLVEQTRVLDRDHRLVGKGAQQLELAWVENAGSGAVDGDAADALAVAHQRQHQRRAHAACAHRCRIRGIVALVGFSVGHQLRPAGAQRRRAAKSAMRSGNMRFSAAALASSLALKAATAATRRRRGDWQVLAPVSRCASRDDGVEHRLHIGGRGGHHAQDVGWRSAARATPWSR